MTNPQTTRSRSRNLGELTSNAHFTSPNNPNLSTSQTDNASSSIMESITVALPNSPKVTVHKGWTYSSKRGGNTKLSSTPPRKGKSSAAHPLKEEISVIGQESSTTKPRQTGPRIVFVNNASEPLHAKDAAVRKLVRSHAMKEVARQRREQKKTKVNIKSEKFRDFDETSFSPPQPKEPLWDEDVEVVPHTRDNDVVYASISQKLDHRFTDYVYQIQANIRRLTTFYFKQLGTAIFPLEFHLAYDPPMSLSALDPSMTDDAVFQSLLYAAAVCSALSGRQKDSDGLAVQTSTTLGLINRLLQRGLGMADGMLAAVSCLAMGDVSSHILLL